MAVTTSIPQGTVLSGKYRVGRELGRGGMAAVYEAENLDIGKRVAIKVLSGALARDEGVTQRFVQEARAVNRIGHHGIVDIFAFGQLADGRQYFVMELLEGRSLKQRLAESPPLSFAEAALVIEQVCDALSAAHAEKIVHRDLKPDNVFLVEGRSQRVAKLLDFGIAKLLDRDESPAQTRSGMPIGTPLYMSPEQCVGKNVDWRTDVYSLGVMMFELFSGRLPFAGASYIETVNAHLYARPPEPTGVPPALARLILRCLEKRAADRPQTADEVRRRLAEICAALDSGGRLAPVGLAAPQRPRRARRGRWLAGALALAVLAVGAVLALRPQAPRVAPAPAFIELVVTTQPPGADVLLDGARQTSPSPTRFRLPRAASVLVRAELAGHAPKERRVAVDEHPLQVHLELAPIADAVPPPDAPRPARPSKKPPKRAPAPKAPTDVDAIGGWPSR